MVVMNVDKLSKTGNWLKQVYWLSNFVYLVKFNKLHKTFGYKFYFSTVLTLFLVVCNNFYLLLVCFNYNFRVSSDTQIRSSFVF